MGISVASGAAGMLLSWVLYVRNPALPAWLAGRMKGIHTVLLNKYYVDELYDFLIIRPITWAAKNVLSATTDNKIIEGIVNGVPRGIRTIGERLRKLQTGYVQHYGIGMAIGLVVIMALALIAAGK